MTNDEIITSLNILLEQAKAKGRKVTVINDVSLLSFEYVINSAIKALKITDPYTDQHYGECDYCKFSDRMVCEYPCSECGPVTEFKCKWEKPE